MGNFPSGRGSENGLVRLDEEHSSGARITLEESGVTAPWSITCGVYGLLVHTVFCTTEAEAMTTVATMKERLVEIAEATFDDDDGLAAITRVLVERFIADF